MRKSELLKTICAECQTAWQKGCQIADIESCKDEDIQIPSCARTNKTHAEISPSIDEEYASTVKRKVVSIDENPGIHRRETENGIRYPCSVSKSSIGANFPLDPLTLRILNLLSIHHYERSISRILARPRVTIQKRIRRLKEMGLIRPESANSYINFYALTPSGIHLLVYDENPTRNQEGKSPFSLHSSRWYFPIISGLQPMSKHPVRMRNWTGYDFKSPLYSIRTTPRSIHVSVNIELTGDSIENLNAKYKELAIGYAGKFAQDHGLTLGSEPKPYQKPHFTLKNNALAKIVSEAGNVRTPDIHIDRSRSNGDLEMGLEAAVGMEYTIAQMPIIVAGLKAEIATLKEALMLVIRKEQEHQEEYPIPIHPEQLPGYQ